MFTFFTSIIHALKSRFFVVNIIANLIPLFGVYWLDWNITLIIFIYYVESIIIVIFNYLKIKNNENPIPTKVFLNARKVESLEEVKKLLGSTTLSFYGLALLIYSVFIWIVFIGQLFKNLDDLKKVGFFLLSTAINILILIFSYWFEYKVNYIGNQENKRESLGVLFSSPLKRVLILHVTIVLGAFSVNSLDQNYFALYIFVLAKIVLDTIGYVNLKFKLEKPFDKVILIHKDGNHTSISYE
jgi:hypothetical protein